MSAGGPRPRFGAKRSVPRDFVAGVLAPLHALRFLIVRPALWKVSFLGAAAAVVVFALLGAFVVPRLDDLLGHYWARPEAIFLAVLWWIVLVLAAAGALAVTLGAALAISAILMAPLYDALSQRVEKTILAPVEGGGSLADFVVEAWQGISHSVLNLTIFGLAMVPVLALNLIPIVGSIASAATGFLLSASMFALEFTDHPQSRRRFRWREKIGLARTEWPAMLGLGFGVTGLLLVPLLDLFLVPVAVVAGTMVFCGLAEADRVAYPDRRVSKSDASVGGVAGSGGAQR